jgi:monoamine oxidase
MSTENIYDVVIIGAGASGLMAAWELVQTGKKVAVVEARNRIGGRINTIVDKNFSLPIEAGAEFVHGDLKLTQLLLKKAGITFTKVSGDIWKKENNKLQKQEDFIDDYSDLEKKFKELKQDISVAQFINEHLQGDEYEELRFTLQNYVEGYYAGDTAKVSTMALCKELTTSDDVQYRVEGGYQKLVDYIFKEAEQKGCFFYFNHAVRQINWKENDVEVITDQKIFKAQKVLLTIPLGVLQSGKITFSPAVDEKIETAKQLGFGPVIKIILQFENAFWTNKELVNDKDLQKLSFLFSGETVPTWWTQHPAETNILTGWLAGPNAEAVKNNDEKEVLLKALNSLHNIFNIDLSFLQKMLKGWHVINWATDPYNCGGYAYDVVNGQTFRKKIKEPLLHTIFFAGEGFYEGPEIGTVEAALVTGREAAHQIVASFHDFI